MRMNRLAFATLVAMGMTAAAIAQQPGEQPLPRSQQTQPAPPRNSQPAPGSRSTETAPAPRGGDRTEQGAHVTFDAADKDKDGKITRDEATVVPGLNFTSADVNADASLSRQEFQTAMAGAQPRG